MSNNINPMNVVTNYTEYCLEEARQRGISNPYAHALGHIEVLFAGVLADNPAALKLAVERIRESLDARPAMDA